MHGCGTLEPRGATRPVGAALARAAGGEPRLAPAAGSENRRERAHRRKAPGRKDADRGAAEADSRNRDMSSDANRDKGALTINLLGRELRVACPEGEERQLLASVDYLNRKLKEVRDVGKVVGNERIALM